MEKEDSNEQTLTKEVKELEMQNAFAHNKLQHVENEINLQMQKKIFCETNIKTLEENVEFYKAASVKLGKKLKITRKIYSQFTIASQCYGKLLSEYTESYLHSEQEEETVVNESVPENSTHLQEQIIHIQSRINQTAEEINTLLNSIQVPETE